MVSAAAVIGRTVRTSDGEDLGRCQNIVVNIRTKHADLLIFPKTVLDKLHAPMLVRNQAGMVVGMANTRGVAQLTQIVGNHAMDVISDLPGGFMGSLLGAWAQKTLRTVDESYYTVPISFIVNVQEHNSQNAQDAIQISVDRNYCRDWFLNSRLTKEHKALYRPPESEEVLWEKKSLNLEYLGDSPEMSRKDTTSVSTGNSGKIKVAELDITSDIASFVTDGLSY